MVKIYTFYKNIIKNFDLDESLVKDFSCKDLSEYLLNKENTDESEIYTIWSKLLNLKYLNTPKYVFDFKSINCISEDISNKYLVFPLYKKLDEVFLLTYRPLDYSEIHEIAFLIDSKIKLILTPKVNIIELREAYYEQNKIQKEVLKEESSKYIKENIKDPTIRSVDFIIKKAIEKRASDIHIEPKEDKFFIKYRVDGDLNLYIENTKNIYNKIISRIKVMSNMDTTERRKPQDGKFNFTIDNNSIDARVSSVATVYGEKLVIRLLNRFDIDLKLDKLGFDFEDLNIIKRISRKSSGIFLVSGPTGSGKTSTLYSIILSLDYNKYNITSIEDPVEYKIQEINQIQTSDNLDLGFYKLLKYVLRQDPDIISIGEIRDIDTSKLALQSAMTGHRVFSTIHTDNIESTIIRLLEMGIKPFYIASALNGIISQRLIKKLCENCSTIDEINKSEMELLGLEDKLSVARPNGCIKCSGTGYLGRILIYEILEVDEFIKNLIIKESNTDALKKEIKIKKRKSFKDVFIKYLRNHKTSIEEFEKI